MNLNIEIDGIKYFIYLISQGRELPYIDTDIRKIIWSYAIEPLFVICNISEDLNARLYIQ